ncbi:Heme-binding protein 2 [Tetrabaena socialis]|uniref:Heme-binding protein 2 n=1 Tax=Tetrabaena socialis TaxID=47790 RepID=A0A2J8A0R4_9CHLO|nr:Heme-binding protein 2 [Tetrabaena socialis]|eukprot:PNH06109.1 Heme-binding protein 2 [Tetrabaena socialis]
MGFTCTLLTLLALGTPPPQCPKPPLKDDAAPWFCHELDCPPYEVELSLGPDAEKRSYAEAVWVSTNVTGMRYDKAVGTGFMRLFAYIAGANELRVKIPMTAPVRVQLTPGQGPFCEDHFVVSFMVPFNLQDAPPAPASSDVYIHPAPAASYYVLSYGGRTHETEIIDKATELLKMLDEKDMPYDYSSFYAAGYDSPFRIFNRHNEVWIKAAGEMRKH